MHAAAILALPTVGVLVSRVVSVAATRTSDRVTAASRLRRSNRVLQVTVALVGLFVVTDSGLDDAVAAAIPGPSDVGILCALAITVVVGGIAPGLAVHLGSRPAWGAVTGNRPAYGQIARRYLKLATLLSAPALFVVGAWLVGPPGFAGVGMLALAVFVLLAVVPPVGALVGPVRELTPAEAAIMPDSGAGLRVRVVETGDRPVANALAAGVLPGFRYVFVTDALFETLDPEAAAAVLAHEAGHHRRGHVVGRFLATVLALAPVFLAANGVLGDVLVPALVSAGLLLAVAPAVRWTEYDADAYAASVVSAPAMERALQTLADRGLLPAEHSRVFGLFALHPAVGDRIARLQL
jgi:STE24 endopeptidase